MKNKARGIRKPFPYTFNNISLILIGINITVYFLTMMSPRLTVYLSLNPVLFFRDHFYWTALTYMFVHGSMNHILFNMLGLFFFGPQLEERMGSWEFLTYYLATGLLAGLMSLGVYFLTGSTNVFLMGASGALFAILLAFAVYFPFSKIYLFGIIPMQTTVMVSLYAGIEIFSLLFGGRGNIAHGTHLLGLLIGYLYFMIRLGTDPVKVFRDSRNNPWKR
ncbi:MULTISPECIES: rhomboid family intramembrane serine protease [unclassified Oceanispirochaeta]|uniref:rhomboid family intramembrane serine protease n=1 Tax=unclassified Oceanispirochaeta TaxID=2635722 RepID=UPI000E097333|nr:MULTISPECIES: rhomboid family intramembrane serine protease [unclassified Oceanispirochaeta]MBF9015360.1 rhomboid family intramembrane serine protease [Oceanispirochaeta sp. M2]NPD71818.1 rhomboid family intramembrane serine protease [Oceanispirochaeta sp. M1]RDG33007.1 rhomboid family intramembrane serine protease [Oceanispirochaeta sp. M1]